MVKKKEFVETYFAKNKDAIHLEQLDKTANEELSWWHPQSKKDFENLMKASRNLFVIAKLGDNYVGYLEAGFKENKKTIWIESVYTVKKFRKKNVAKMLMETFLDFWKLKVENVVLLTADKNLKIFRKLGFEKTMNYMELVK